VPPTEPIDHDLLVAATRALPRVTRAIERALGDVSLADYRILSAIAGGEARASRMAAHFALGKPAISASIDSLSRRGLVEKAGVEGDNRAVALTLTAQGTAYFEAAEALATARLEKLAALAPDPVAALSNLVALSDAIETVIANREVTA
jgi:DNA-binding MarR family transcriptional regulator